MRWRAEPSAFSPSDLAGAYRGKGFAMPLAQVCDEGMRAAAEADVPALAARTDGRASLVTGGSGFLGARLVAGLLDAGDAVIVAARSPGALLAQWTRTLGGARAEALWASPGLRAVAVDLTAPGAERALLEAVAGLPLRTVFHLAAKVHAFAGWEAMRAANLDATLVAARVSAAAGARLQVASTLSVFVSSDGTGEGEETPLDRGSDALLFGGYAQTKAAAEVAALASRGPCAQALRYGLLVPRTALTSRPTTSCAPSSRRSRRSAPSPTGRPRPGRPHPGGAGRGGGIAVDRDDGHGVFHYANPVPASLTEVVGAVDAALVRAGRPALDVVPAARWRERVDALPRLPATLLTSAFDKPGFLAGAARRGPFLNADLFQSTGRSYGIGRSLAAGAPVPTHPADQLDRLVAPLIP